MSDATFIINDLVVKVIKLSSSLKHHKGRDANWDGVLPDGLKGCPNHIRSYFAKKRKDKIH